MPNTPSPVPQPLPNSPIPITWRTGPRPGY